MGSLAFVLHSLVEWLGGKKEEVLSLQVDVSPIHWIQDLDKEPLFLAQISIWKSSGLIGESAFQFVKEIFNPPPKFRFSRGKIIWHFL